MPVDAAKAKKLMQEDEQIAQAHLKLMKGGELANMYEVYPEEKKLPTPPMAEQMKIPWPLQCIFCGRTGSGKTNGLLNLLRMLNCCSRYWLYTKDTEEHLYDQFIKEQKEKGKALGKELIKVDNQIKTFPDIVKVGQFMKSKNEWGAVIIDDMVNESPRDLKDTINVFTLGRKENLSPFFLTQSWFRVPIVMREQVGCIALGRLSGEQDMKRIIKEFPALMADADEISGIYKRLQLDDGNMSFLTVFPTANCKGLQYRRNFAPYSIYDEQGNLKSEFKAAVAKEKDEDGQDDASSSSSSDSEHSSPSPSPKASKKRHAGSSSSSPKRARRHTPAKRSRIYPSTAGHGLAGAGPVRIDHFAPNAARIRVGTGGSRPRPMRRMATVPTYAHQFPLCGTDRAPLVRFC